MNIYSKMLYKGDPNLEKFDSKLLEKEWKGNRTKKKDKIELKIGALQSNDPSNSVKRCFQIIDVSGSNLTII